MSNTSQPTMDQLEIARRRVEKMLDLHLHTVYIGTKNDDDETLCVVVEVKQKMDLAEVKSRGLAEVPKNVNVRGTLVPTDVREEVGYRGGKLPVDPDTFVAEANNLHQNCHDCPIPGGVQIAPRAPWVGTLGCGVSFKIDGKQFYGALTNRHVALTSKKLGEKMFQPLPGGDHIGTLARFSGLKFHQNRRNRIDAALINCHRTGGKYAPGTHTVGNDLLGLGKLNPEPVLKPSLLLKVKKSGRTTGVTVGKIVGINATSRVEYDEGVATFEKQLVIRPTKDHRNFSRAGDSGSLVVDNDNRPVGLLFAGGGGSTLANPVSFIMGWSDVRFFGQQ